ncbi:MAG TPA: GntR family transcriptional regulator [Bryobacteraceae bacterium]|jgi:DNA-binding GntR family transcriptional regulator|nr:GntR family transcriptional regulator [Bryobacteraceae bacterium]
MASQASQKAPDPLQLPALSRRRTTDDVYDVMRKSILSNVFQPGQRLPVDDIARKLGVSLTPVRHAIQQLATEGLIEIRPRSGTFVAKLEIRDINETFDIRRALECLAAETAVRNVTDEQLRRARKLLWALSEPIETEGDRTRHEANNFEFHRLIIEASANQRLAELYESLKAHLQIARVHRAESPAPSIARLQEEQSEHEQILAALEARDAAKLSRAIQVHIDRAKSSLVSSVEELTDS